AKIRWAIEGNENSKFFHGIINKKHSQLAIRGVLIDGDWIVDPSRVKNEFPNQLSPNQANDLKSRVSYDEIKNAVWDCGTNKSPGPDDFTFEFFQKYRKIVDNDVVVVVLFFFASGLFPPGCNSSFIALIPKMQDAKLILDGPFIPNELLSWCKYKKSKALIFKIDFEKAFNSVR
ncbi:hypothetical protein Tco_1060558, partial [Tanacetum coccineum]